MKLQQANRASLRIESRSPSIASTSTYTETTSVFSQHAAVGNEEVVATMKQNVNFAMTMPHMCPLSIAYGDVLTQRATEVREDQEKVEHMLTFNLIYFTLIRHFCELDDRKDLYEPVDVQASAAKDSSKGDPLWHVLDVLILKQRKIARKWAAAGRRPSKELKKQALATGSKQRDDAWNIFWEHFRAEPGKTASVQIASARANLGGRLTTKGIYPSVSRRIVQEWDNLENGDRYIIESPPSSAQTAFQRTWGSGFSSAPRGSVQKDKEDIRTWGFEVDDPKAALVSSKGFVKQSARNRSAGTPGTPQNLAARSNSRQRKSREGSPGSGQPKRRMGKIRQTNAPSVSRNLPSIPNLNLQERGPASQSEITSKFTSYDDYRQRRKLLQSTDVDVNTRQLVETASKKPQRQVSAALLEHRAAVEWRMARGNAAPAGAKTGAMTERSRRIHLPSLVQKRGCETERGGHRSGLAVPSLPPATFRRPWSRESKQVTRLPSLTPGIEPDAPAIQRYAQIVQNTGIHPQPASVNYLVQLPPMINLRGRGYGDDDLLALIAALPRDSSLSVEAFDMGENPRLTDKSASLVLHALASGTLGTLQSLRLDHCRQLFRETISLCTMLLSTGYRNETLKDLQVLDLSGISIPLQEYVELARAVQMHLKLRDVRLAETGLGKFDKAHAGRVIGLLVQAAQLQALDLAWNVLDAAALQTLGKGIVDNEMLNSLGLASAGASFDVTLGGSPMLVFIEFLSADYTLTNLDLSNNALNHVAPLVLEYALQRHPMMQKIDISNNPIGMKGKRSLLRLLASPDCPHLTTIVFDECYSGGKETSTGPFDGDPSGCYTMNLAQPGDRAFLKLLLSRCTEGGDAAPPLQKLMRSATYKINGTQVPFNFKLLRRGENNAWEVPVAGELSFELSAAELIVGTEQSMTDDIPVFARIQNMFTKHRFRLPGGSKTVSLLCQVKNSKDQVELDTLLQAVSADFILTAEQVQGLCTTKMKHALITHDLAGTLCKLLPCLSGHDDFRKVVHCTRTLMDLHSVHERSYELLNLNLENPTGRYQLLLSDPPSRSVAEKLLLLNRWELQVWNSSGRPDISQSANGKNFRNTRLDDRKFTWTAEEWRLPYDEILSFDYASLRRPSETAQPIDEEKFRYMLRVMRDARSEGATDLLMQRVGRNAPIKGGENQEPDPSSPKAGVEPSSGKSNIRPRRSRIFKSLMSGLPDVIDSSRTSDELVIESIRAVTPHFYISCRQCRELLRQFNSQEIRLELVVVICQRIVDWPMNANLAHSKVDQKQWQELKQRVGYIYCFPFMQPENYHDSLDLSNNEQRRVLHLLTSLCSQEFPDNIKYPRVDWQGPSSGEPSWNYFPNGLPLSWSNWEHVPIQGVFESVYLCSGDNMKLKARRKLAYSVGGFTAMPEDQQELESSLKFWTVLGGVPEEVHHYLYFMVVTFKSLRQAFSKIDSNGDGEISLKEFVDGCKKCGFRLPPEPEESQEDKEPITPRNKPKKVNAFQKEDERVEQNLREVYRFLDPNKDGSVSVREFFALEGMWRELKQTMWEFVEHCRNKFGSLDQAWEAADVDHSGTIDSNEFELLAREWNFDGPVAQVYMSLDINGNNSVSRDEWLTLESIVKPVW